MKAFNFRSVCLGLACCLPLVAASAELPPAPPPPPTEPFQNIGVAEFDRLRAQPAAVVLDVRTAKEFARGHLPGAMQIDWSAPDFDQKVAGLDRDKIYLVHCAVGGRSAQACRKMSQLQFKRLYNLEGGLKAWERAGKPLER